VIAPDQRGYARTTGRDEGGANVIGRPRGDDPSLSIAGACDGEFTAAGAIEQLQAATAWTEMGGCQFCENPEGVLSLILPFFYPADYCICCSK
jgi:hypothetical protein